MGVVLGSFCMSWRHYIGGGRGSHIGRLFYRGCVPCVIRLVRCRISECITRVALQ